MIFAKTTFILFKRFLSDMTAAHDLYVKNICSGPTQKEGVSIEGLISVIVPIYNLEDLLKNSVQSIIRQTYPHLEIILVDDGSTDQTFAVMQSLAEKDKRIVLIHQENSGVSKARLAGVLAAHGDWIGFVDGDDEIETDMYERLLGNMIRNHAQISHCGYKMVFPNREELFYGTGRVVLQNQQQGLLDLIEGTFVEPGLCNKLFQRELFQKTLNNLQKYTDLRNMEDLLFNFYLFRESGLSVYEDFCPYKYIVRPNSAATAKWNEHKLYDPLTVLKTIEDETAENDELHNAISLRVTNILIKLSTLSSGSQSELIGPCRSQARKELKGKLKCAMVDRWSMMQKLKMLLAAWCPGVYSFIHSLYEKLTGIDRRYEVS